MTTSLARIFGTEEDKVNCPFYYKIGACRHGDRCSRVHVRPNFSQTLLIPHMYQVSPPGPDGNPLPDTDRFNEFAEEVFDEFKKYGSVLELNICSNLGDHMLGNVYIKYSKEEEAEGCMKGLHGRYYAGQLVLPEFSPVTDFREARCRQYDEGICGRGGYCNFLHMKTLPNVVARELTFSRKPPRDPPPNRGRDNYRDRDRDRPRYRSRSPPRRSRSRSPARRDRDPRRIRSFSPSRFTSEERRAVIADWNREREEQLKAQEKLSHHS